MSHFTVLVVGKDPEAQLQPFHEFECTGENDQYVQDVDKTQEAKEEYEKSTVTRIKDQDGNLYVPRDDKFYRDPTPAESKKVGMGSGFADGISFTSKDWGDGQGYRAKVRFIPDGMQEVTVKQSEVESFRDWATDYYGLAELLPGETPDLQEKHKYGYAQLDEKGEVLKLIDRTNPNAKWDWYQVGGRWAGFFKLKEGATGTQGTQSWMQRMQNEAYPQGSADQAYKGDIDFDTIREKERIEAGSNYDKLLRLLGEDTMPKLKYTWKEVIDGEKFANLDIQEKRAIYHAQKPIEKINTLSRDEKIDKEDRSFLTWLEYEKYNGKTRDEFVAKAGQSAISTFAVILDGKWYERGEMGWCAVVSNEKDQDQWDEEFSKLLESVPDDTLLTLVDCHI